MMIVQAIINGTEGMDEIMYEADCAPRVGEQIAVLDIPEHFTVTHITHIIRTRKGAESRAAIRIWVTKL